MSPDELRLLTWLEEGKRRKLEDAVLELVISAAALRDCDCRIRHACCLDSDTGECYWGPCPDCDVLLAGTSWVRPIGELAEMVADLAKELAS